MTFSARITAASCVLALSVSYGSVLAGAESGGSVAVRPWPVSPFEPGERLEDHSIVNLPWKVSRSRTGGSAKDRTATGQPQWISRSATGDSFFESHGWPDSCPGDCAAPAWTVTADALLLWRSPTHSQAILFAPAFDRPDVVLLDAADMASGVQSGPRIGLTGHLVNNFFLEANYFGIDGGTSSAERDGNPLALFPPGILVSSHFSVGYDSDLHSAEVNLRHRCSGRLDLLAGARWVQLREGFHVVGPNPLDASFPDVRYDTLVGNSMYGFQIGAHDRLFDRGGPLRVDGFIKAGIYANNGNQETSTQGNLGNHVAAAARGNHRSMLGEVGLAVLYRLGDHLDVRGGYQAMWIDGVALAPNQISTTNVLSSPPTATLDFEGSSFYHGCHVGLEAHW